MLQGFQWRSQETYPWWNVINGKAADIGASGFKMVWLPPSSKAASAEGYLPNALYTQTNNYGTQAQLQGAIAALHARGVKVSRTSSSTTAWAPPTGRTSPTPPGAPTRVPRRRVVRRHRQRRHRCRERPARDIDHTQAFVQTDLKTG